MINISKIEAEMLQGAIICSEYLPKRKQRLVLSGDTKSGRVRSEVVEWSKNFSEIEFVGLCTIGALDREVTEYLYCARDLHNKLNGDVL